MREKMEPVQERNKSSKSPCSSGRSCSLAIGNLEGRDPRPAHSRPVSSSQKKHHLPVSSRCYGGEGSKEGGVGFNREFRRLHVVLSDRLDSTWLAAPLHGRCLGLRRLKI